MIFSSACFSVRPRVISLVICSPAILPMAASWIRRRVHVVGGQLGDGAHRPVVHDDGVALRVAAAGRRRPTRRERNELTTSAAWPPSGRSGARRMPSPASVDDEIGLRGLRARR